LAFFGLSDFPNVSFLRFAFEIRNLLGSDVHSIPLGVRDSKLKPNKIRAYESGLSIERHDQKFSVSGQSYVRSFLVIHFSLVRRDKPADWMLILT
jgi:hypothetical protein